MNCLFECTLCNETDLSLSIFELDCGCIAHKKCLLSNRLKDGHCSACRSAKDLIEAMGDWELIDNKGCGDLSLEEAEFILIN